METKKFEKQQQKVIKQTEFLMPPYPLTNFEIQNIIKIKLNLMEFILEIIFPKIKDRAYVINLDEYSDTEIHRTALYVLNNNITYFGSFEVEHILQEIKTFIGNENIKTNVFRIQAYDSMMCGYFCIGFIDFMLAGKILTSFTTLFSPNNFKKMMIQF